jgi:CBS domain-containing protein/ribosomal protein S18 acetylase RimI-like enzyme
MKNRRVAIAPDATVGVLPHPFIDRRRRPMLFRQVTAADRPRVLQMYRDFEPKESYQGLPPASPERLEAWVADMLATGFNIVGLSLEQEPVCHGAIFGVDAERCDFVIAVAPSRQGAGIGVQLTRLVKKAAQALGFTKIWLCVESYNQKAKHIYHKLGFDYTYRTLCDECEMLVDLSSDPAMALPARSIMTRDVIALRDDQSARAAIQSFLTFGISGLPVLDAGGSLVGFVTETDVLEKWTSERGLEELMTKTAVFAREETTIAEIVALICDRGVKQIPVVAQEGMRLVGIVSRKDILRHLYARDSFF